MEKQILLIITWRKHNPPTIFNQLGLVFDWSISVAPNGCRKRTRCGTFLGCIALIIKERRSAIADILKKRAEHVAHQVWDLHAFTGNKESNLENEWINYIMNACMHASIHQMEWNGMKWKEYMIRRCTLVPWPKHAMWLVVIPPSMGIHTWINHQSESLEKCIDCGPKISKG